MRQLTVRVPRGTAAAVLAAAQEHRGANLAAFEGSAEDGRPVDIVLVQVSNARVGPLLDDLEQLPDLHVTLAPQGVITLRPPASESPDQATDVTARSPVEVFLGGLQSVGSWAGFLGYAAAAGVVVWIGLFTNTSYLLVGAMLIAPFAGPAMNAALATARGDAALFGRALGRYFAALAVTIAVAAMLTLLLRQQVATDQMVETSLVSSVAVLLPLVAGAAGALNLCQSERSSLVSGAATGMLVAASLAPPAGLVGTGAAMGEWDMVWSAGFVLLLQLAGINAAGAVVFHSFGLVPEGVRFARGRRSVGLAAWGGSLVALAALLAVQFSDPPSLQRSTRAQRAEAVVQRAVNETGSVLLVEADARFTRAGIPGQDTLLVTVFVQAERATERETLGQRLAERIKARLAEQFDATPLVEVTVLTR